MEIKFIPTNCVEIIDDRNIDVHKCDFATEGVS